MGKYRILVKTDGIVNDFIIGKISGIIWALSGMPEVEQAVMKNKKKNYEYQVFECTDEQYQDIVNAIWNRYGGIVKYEIEEILEED